MRKVYMNIELMKKMSEENKLMYSNTYDMNDGINWEYFCKSKNFIYLDKY